MIRHLRAGPVCAALLLGLGPALADGVPASKQTTLGLYLSAEETARFLERTPQAVLIDVRTEAEVVETGLAMGTDALIPLAIPDRARGAVPNPDFLPGITQLVRDRSLAADQPIVLICRSGNRSAEAADALARMGFTRVYTVTDGIEGDRALTGARTVNGWKNAGLPLDMRPFGSCAPALRGLDRGCDRTGPDTWRRRAAASRML
jgi:rhodanese-related sulfurtransferase